MMKLKTAMLLGAGLTAALSYASAFSGGVYSGYTLLKQETKDMQDDDFMNPGMVTVANGAAMFSAQGQKGMSCASCHGEGGKKLDPKHIAQYPVLDAKTQRPITLQQRIIDEWAERLGNPPLKYESDDALALEAFVRNLARGQVVNVQTDGAMAPFYAQGKQIYETRGGQLNMACNLCHEDHVGQRLRAQVLSQGQTNGFPLYRLDDGKLVGTQTRVNQCYQSLRAEERPFGSEAMTMLELYLNALGNGLKIETPAVRF
jgi:L-cysteine S-thiosulfotransferase